MKFLLLILPVFLVSCATMNGPTDKEILNRKAASTEEEIRRVKALKDFTLNLGEVNRISEYCYFNPLYEYVRNDEKTYFEAYDKSKLKGKKLTLKEGAEFNVYLARKNKHTAFLTVCLQMEAVPTQKFIRTLFQSLFLLKKEVKRQVI